MRFFDKTLSVIIMGMLAPVIFMLLFWWGSIPFVKNNDPLLFTLALTGLIVGVLLDLTVLRRFILKLFDLSIPVLTAIEIFYSIMIYGFFMGFPVFNSIVGIAGAYIAARSAVRQHASGEQSLKNTNHIIRLSTIILFALCSSSALLALGEKTIGSQVKGMLHVPFNVTMGMIWFLILAGGCMLLIFQYCASKIICAKIIAKG